MVDPTILAMCGGIGPLALRVPVGSEVFDRLGVAFGRSRVVDPAAGGPDRGDMSVVAGIRPDEIWLVGSRDRIRDHWSALSSDAGFDAVPAIDLTPGMATFQLAGPCSRSLLEKICSLDWSDEMTPNGAAVSAGVARVACDIIRVDGYRGHPGPGYLIMCGRSYGRYLEECLIDAGQEFGIEKIRPDSLPN